MREVWSVECEVCSVECGVVSVRCGVWNVECGMWSGKCGVWSVECDVWRVKGGVWSLECGVTLGSALCKICSTKTKGRPLGIAPSAAPATQKPPALPRKSHRQSGGDQGTPGRASDPLQSTKCRACHATV